MATDPATEEVEELETGAETETEEAEIEEVEAEETGEEPETEEETEEAEGDEGDEEEAEETAAKPSRGANLRKRAQEAERLAREASDRAERLERDIEDLRRRQQSRSDPEAEARERERLALMSPEERAEHRIQQTENRLTGELRRTQFMLSEQNDKAAFDAKCASDPVYRKYQDRVESELQKIRRGNPAAGVQPQNVPRERLLELLIGQDALKRRGEAGTRQRRTEQVRARETVRPGGGARSDTQAARGKKGKTAADRLSDVTF